MEYELYHHGVKGMKWGVRKAKKLQSKAKTARESAKEWDEMAKYARQQGNKKKALKYQKNAKRDRDDAKELDSRADDAIAKQKYKDAVKKRSKQILKGKSAVGKILSVVTDSHKIQAEIELDIEKRAKVNKAWRD